MYLLIFYFYLINFILLLLGGRFFSKKGSYYLILNNMIISFFLSIFIFIEIGLNQTNCYILLFNWISLENLILNWNFYFDTVNSLMLIIISLISLLVNIYSFNYMKEDPHFIRFMAYLSLFTFFMTILITANNFIQMFLGWEGVGIVSFLLISFWNTRTQAIKSAIKAIILNRIGDFSLIFGISLIFLSFKTLDFDIINLISKNYKDIYYNFFFNNFFLLDLINFFILIGAIGKSAQLGLHIWLPDAMEGPTPVSALIHAATMVTAGIFLLIKCNSLLENSPFILKFITILGALTAFVAGTIGLVQNDLKKIIAYSTCSQLGYMFVAIGLNSYYLSLFHLLNHAFFKALLFLSAGAIIHTLNDEQDLRKMGGLNKILPFIYTCFLIGSFALMGIPFLTGFYSKDLILELSYSSFNNYSFFSYFLIISAAFITSFYSLRLLILTFYNKINAYKKIIENIHEVDFFLGIPLFILSLFSIFIGFFWKDFCLGINTDSWNNSLYIYPQNYKLFEIEFFIPFYIKIFPLFLCLLSIFFIYIFFFYIKKNYILF